MLEFIDTLITMIASGMILVPFIRIMIGCNRYHAKICFILIFIGFAWFAVNIIIYHLFYIGDDDKYID